ncbi:MAG TPA: ABC transporter permease [Candidatus Limnocylindrales bacterium]|jgi:ABC-type transport system involved in multi-copper enzyme maturation permease subunit
MNDDAQVAAPVVNPDEPANREAGPGGVPDEPAGAPPRRSIRRFVPTMPRGWGTGVTAIGVKELRGRMRGRRAFVFVTIYLLILGGFAWMVEVIAERSVSFGVGGALASATIGQAVFVALLMFETLLIIVLAPSFTAGAISLEREKQTLDLLAVTPISSLAIVLGKLISAMTYVFILVLASIPLTAVVFVFGGAGPDDLIRGYVVLLATAIGLGSVGLFFSALVRRTQAATILTYAGVLLATLGAVFIYLFWGVVQANSTANRDAIAFQAQRPPEALLYFNPFVAMADVACGTQASIGSGFCSLIASIEGQTFINGGVAVPAPTVGPAPAVGGGAVVGGAVVGGAAGAGDCVVFSQPDGSVIQKGTCNGPVPMPVQAVPGPVQGGGIAQPVQFQPQVAPFRDTFWPKSVVAWLALSAFLLFLSLRLVTPTRGWRLGRPGRRRPSGQTAA